MPIRLLSQYLQLLAAALLCRGHERGQVGMEIALVGVICASCVLGAVVLATSDQASQQVDGVLRAGLYKSGGRLVVKGSVVALAEGDPLQVDEIVFTLGVAGNPGPVSLGNSSAAPRLVLAFRGETVLDNDVPYTAAEIVGNGDGLLQAGEIAEVRVAIDGINDGSLVLGPTSQWALELQAPVGGVLEIRRTLPFALQRVNSLH